MGFLFWLHLRFSPSGLWWAVNSSHPSRVPSGGPHIPASSLTGFLAWSFLLSSFVSNERAGRYGQDFPHAAFRISRLNSSVLAFFVAPACPTSAAVSLVVPVLCALLPVSLVTPLFVPLPVSPSFSGVVPARLDSLEPFLCLFQTHASPCPPMPPSGPQSPPCPAGLYSYPPLCLCVIGARGVEELQSSARTWVVPQLRRLLGPASPPGC